VTQFLEISFELGALAPAGAEQACLDCGASAITFVDARDEPVLEPAPGEVRLWSSTRLKALFAPGNGPETTLASLSRSLGVPVCRLHAHMLEDRAWEREWLRDFHAMQFGRRLWICPHHERVEAPDAVVVHMDPGLAFGTGTHPTTALCLEWLDAHPPTGEVIDYGCGSGVLALAAAKLGARAVHCFDIDDQALLATRDNTLINGLGERIRLCGSCTSLPRSDLLLANILSAPLVALAPRFAALVRVNGALVLSGLMDHQAREVLDAFEKWFDMATCGSREGWTALSGRRHDRPAS
jgi:ribosomal protein L11 methyltransferase